MQCTTKIRLCVCVCEGFNLSAISVIHDCSTGARIWGKYLCSGISDFNFLFMEVEWYTTLIHLATHVSFHLTQLLKHILIKIETA